MRDSIDRHLISLLEEDARVSCTELARKLGLARSTVHERISRLERDGVILGYSALVAPDQDNVRALIFLSTEQRYGKNVVLSLKRFPEIRSCHAINGQDDLVCWAEMPCLEDLDALVDELAGVSHVKNTNSTIIMTTKFQRASRSVVSGHPKVVPISSAGLAR